MTQQAKRVTLFDAWAARYDTAVAAGGGDFPFAGYDEVLATAVRTAGARPSLRVLELGIGTGNLAERFVAVGCQLWGLDFSTVMLAQARERLPHTHLAQADLLAAWPLFDRIVAAYVLHEFDLADKIRLLQRAARHFLGPGGFLVVADIAFPTTAVRAAAAERWARWWDEEEFYWAADEAIATGAEVGLSLAYQQVSRCAGVFTVRVGGTAVNPAWDRRQ
jgi:ubiquinone/menaquinone biosynthesis C-methylase UbiE